MDIKFSNNEISICEIELLSSEQSFESDILLPDYYQDIMKVLKCTAEPVVSKASLLGDKIVVDGAVSIKVYYQTVDSQLKVISSKINFSKTFEIKNQMDSNIYINPKISLEYVNCRAINERKIDIKGALSLKLKIYCNLKENILTDAKGAGLQIKNDNIKCMMVTGNNNNQFVIKEDVSLENTKPDIGNIIRYEDEILSLDKKIIDNKIILKGEIKLKVLYSPFNENGEEKIPVTTDFILPFNQIIDLPGLNQEDDCQIKLSRVWAEVTPKSDENGRSRLLSIDIGFNVNVKCHKEIESNVIIDAYSTLKEIEHDDKTINCYKILNKINERVSVEASVAIPGADNLIILDVWNSPKIVFSKKTDEGLSVEGKTQLSILGLENNEPVYIEKLIDFKKLIPVDNVEKIDLKSDLDIESIDISYSLNYDSLDLKIDLLLTGYLYENNVVNIIKDIKIDEDAKLKERSEDDSLVVYYASPGEDIWKLAKKYNTNISAILEENEDLKDNIINEKKMILIPIVN